MKVLIAGGGTGGHTIPGIALKEEILRRDQDHQVRFLVSNRPVDKKILASINCPVEYLSLPRLPEKNLKIFSFLLKWWSGYRKVSGILNAYHPDVVVGVGGYIAALPVYLAWRKKVPVVLLEQNIIPGRANKRLLKYARRLCLSFEESMNYLDVYQDRLIVTGNPVRASLLTSTDAADITGLKSDLLTVLIIGGSQGAQYLNRVAPVVFDKLKKNGHQFQVFHLSGEQEFADVERRYQELNIHAIVHPYYEDMGSIYRRADLVLARAGATTMAEIMAMGKPSILIPYPHAMDQHQQANADWLAGRRGCILVNESQHAIDMLIRGIESFLNNEALRNEMARNAERASSPDAAKVIVDLITKVGTLNVYRRR